MARSTLLDPPNPSDTGDGRRLLPGGGDPPGISGSPLP